MVTDGKDVGSFFHENYNPTTAYYPEVNSARIVIFRKPLSNLRNLGKAMNVLDPSNTDPLQYGNRLLTIAKNAGWTPSNPVNLKISRSFLKFFYTVSESQPATPTKFRQVWFKPSNFSFSVSRFNNSNDTWSWEVLEDLTELDQDPNALQAIVGQPY